MAKTGRKAFITLPHSLLEKNSLNELIGILATYWNEGFNTITYMRGGRLPDGTLDKSYLKLTKSEEFKGETEINSLFSEIVEVVKNSDEPPTESINFHK